MSGNHETRGSRDARGDEPTGNEAEEHAVNETEPTTQRFPGAEGPHDTAGGAAAPAASAPVAQSTAQTAPQERRLPARFSTILWGVIVLAFAVAVGALRNADAIPDPLTWITGALIVGGVALVVIGIAAALRRAG